MHCDTTGSPVRKPIDLTDWLKTFAILFVVVDHVGLFFIEDDEWWRVVGRMAAPIFFFLIGFSRRESVPINWIVLGIILTVLDSCVDERFVPILKCFAHLLNPP